MPIQGYEKKTGTPKTVEAVKEVRLALVTYNDERGDKYTQVALVGDTNVHLIDGQLFGFSDHRTPQGRVSKEWLSKPILEALAPKKMSVPKGHKADLQKAGEGSVS